MEYVPGGDLMGMIDKVGYLNEELAKRIILQSLYALKHLHDLNICHRDLKPENIIIIEEQSTVKLIDFGMSKILQHNSAQMNS